METFDAKREKLCHKNLAATVLHLIGKGIDGWGRVYYDFYIYDLRSERVCEPQFPGQVHGVFPTLATVSSSVFHSAPAFVSSSAERNASIKRATLAAASRQTANQS